MDTNNHELWKQAKAGLFIPKNKFVKIRVNLWLFQTAKMFPGKLIGNKNMHNANEKEVLS